MSNQPKAAARSTDPDTSHEAAATVDVQRHADLILGAVCSMYGHPERGWLTFTAAQVVENLTATTAISPSSVRSRLKELRGNGYLEWVEGDEGYLTRSGRRHRLLRVTEKGKRAYFAGSPVSIKRTVSRETVTIPYDPFLLSDAELGERIADAVTDIAFLDKMILKIKVVRDV